MGVVIKSYPHKDNFCGGNFQDWLEVNLISKCNAKCKWCVENYGYHPTGKVSWPDIADKAIATGKKNIILLGGEPTLYKDIGLLASYLNKNHRNVFITTNGSTLTRSFAKRINSISGLNISIHHYDFGKNKEITGLRISLKKLLPAIKYIKLSGCQIRLNCNLIKDHIDSEIEILKFIDFAKKIGADSVRFAELKFDDDNFIDLNKIFNGQYGLNDDPFINGCNQNTIINGMKINFRQMCGFQTSKRNKPVNPEQYPKQVLYYDGTIYSGWQSIGNIDNNALKQILSDVSNQKMTAKEASKFLTA